MLPVFEAVRIFWAILLYYSTFQAFVIDMPFF
jgi:hypothetical protein